MKWYTQSYQFTLDKTWKHPFLVTKSSKLCGNDTVQKFTQTHSQFYQAKLWYVTYLFINVYEEDNDGQNWKTPKYVI